MTDDDWAIECGNCGADDEAWHSPSGTLCTICEACGECRKCTHERFQ